MSRTTLCAVTAAGLVTLSMTLMIGRYHILGDEVKVPSGPGTWKVTMLVNGKSTGTNAKLMSYTPLDFGRQHIIREVCHSTELLDKPPQARHPERRQVLWSQRAGTGEGPFRAFYEFYCTMDVKRPSSSMAKLARTLSVAPEAGEYLKAELRVECDNPEISTLARKLTAGHEGTGDQVEEMFRYVQEVRKEPSVGNPGLSAVECLKNGSGDSAAKSRLLVALCRNRGIPARLVTGLTLAKGHEQIAHYWVEAWVHDHWLPLCPFYHHCGRVPSTYLVFGYGDLPIVKGRNVKDLDYAFLVEHTNADESIAEVPAALSPRQLLKQIALDNLPPPEQRLVEFLLLLPIAALIICFYRNVIGLNSFGTFAPALVGLAFRDLHSLPGILVFISIVLVGWGMRRILDVYHLLQVPRTAFMLSLVVIVLITAIVTANFEDLPATKYISLFPMVILTGMIERFWTLEVEDGTTSSFRTLAATMLISATIALILSINGVVNHMFRYPETLGLIMAAQLLIGRYTGFRVSELFRFRDFMQPSEA